jgi:hypothetical protein
MQPTSAALLRLLFFAFVLVTIKCSAPLFPPPLVCDVHFNKFGPSADVRIRRNYSIYVCNLVLLQDFFEVWTLEIACCVNYGAFFKEEVTVIGCCYAFGSYFVFCSFLPQFFPLYSEFFNHFFLGQTHLYQIPP